MRGPMALPAGAGLSLAVGALLALSLLGGCPDEPRQRAEETPPPALGEATPTPAPEPADRVLPVPDDASFDVVFVYRGGADEGAWNRTHERGRQQLDGDGVRTAVVEHVEVGGAAGELLEALAASGFELIVVTSFELGAACEAIAAAHPDTAVVHVAGIRAAGDNLGTLHGSIEEVAYLAGMLAGHRAEKDGNRRIGLLAPQPLAEVIRTANALAMGARAPCPACSVEIRWTGSWDDDETQRAAAEVLLDGGVHVLASASPGDVALTAAAARDRYAIGHGLADACAADPEHCLTALTWDWGPSYARVVAQIRDGSWSGGHLRPPASAGLVGLYGFMPGEQPTAAVPEVAVEPVRGKLSAMRSGTLDRFDLFRGPLRDNGGRIVVEDGVALTQEDLEGVQGVPGRADCTVCMGWLVEGIVGSLP